MSPYMKAYEAGIKLAQTEFFDKVAAPPKTKQVDSPAGSNQQVKAPAPKAPAPKAPAPKAPAPKAPARTPATNQTPAQIPQAQRDMAAKIQNPKVKQMVQAKLRRANQKQQGGSAQSAPTPAPQRKPVNNANTSTANQRPSYYDRVSNVANSAMDASGRLFSNAGDYISNIFSSDEKPASSPTPSTTPALEKLIAEQSRGGNMTSATPQNMPRAGRGNSIVDSLLAQAEQSKNTPTPNQPAAATEAPQFEMPTNFKRLEPSLMSGKEMGRSFKIQDGFGQKSEPSFLDNVMGRVRDFASDAQKRLSSPELLSRYNEEMDSANQETAANIPGTAENEARREQEEAAAIANRFDVRSGGYGRQLRRFRDQFSRDEATKELLDSINYRDFASALGNRGLQVGDQIDARDIINRLRQQQGLTDDGPVDTDNMEAIGIRDSRGRKVNRGALGRRRRPARVTQPRRQYTKENPNMTDNSPALLTGFSDLTPAERGRSYGDLEALKTVRDEALKEFREDGEITPEEYAELRAANEAIQSYAGIDDEIESMYNREAPRIRNIEKITGPLRGRTAPRTGPSASELLAGLRRQGRY